MNENRSCHHCGGPVRASGPKSRSGRYYCSKIDCRCAKQRDWYQSIYNRDGEAEPAPTQCKSCGRPLKPRRKRRNDSPFGRWCRAAVCQRDRALTEQSSASSSENDRLINLFLARSKVPEMIRTCPRCGLENTVDGFIHPIRGDGGGIEICDGVGDLGVKTEIAEMRWPQVFAVE